MEEGYCKRKKEGQNLDRGTLAREVEGERDLLQNTSLESVKGNASFQPERALGLKRPEREARSFEPQNYTGEAASSFGKYARPCETGL